MAIFLHLFILSAVGVCLKNILELAFSVSFLEHVSVTMLLFERT